MEPSCKLRCRTTFYDFGKYGLGGWQSFRATLYISKSERFCATVNSIWRPAFTRVSVFYIQEEFMHGNVWEPTCTATRRSPPHKLPHTSSYFRLG